MSYKLETDKEIISFLIVYHELSIKVLETPVKFPVMFQGALILCFLVAVQVNTDTDTELTENVVTGLPPLSVDTQDLRETNAANNQITILIKPDFSFQLFRNYSPLRAKIIALSSFAKCKLTNVFLKRKISV